MASLADFLFSGMLVAFPTLKLAYSEGQIGWIPYVLERADTVWDEQPGVGSSRRTTSPSRRRPTTTGASSAASPPTTTGSQSLDEVGADNICFETDYPHTDTTWPDTKEVMTKLTAGLSDTEIHQILRGNAITLLRLPFA